jgi:hypothetical protein
MQMHRVALSLALPIACGIAMQAPASSEEYRGTMEQQLACTPDVWRLCSDQIPDANRIVACLRQNTPQLSDGCRAVFLSRNRAPQQPAKTPRGRQPSYDNSVQPPRNNDDWFKW